MADTVALTTRLEGWESRLAAAIAEARCWSYAQGEHDCITLVCRCVLALTGVDLWTNWAGKYCSQRGADVMILRLADFKQPYLTHAVSHVLGVLPWPPLLARRGDVVEFDATDGPHLGVCNGMDVAGFGPDGVYFVPLKACRHCWRVG